jgi:tetratricopeptide (TPR) repeat protein
MAQVFLTRGDLDRALALYQESLQLGEQLGDKKGKAASLHQMANILMARSDWLNAEQVLQESLQLASEVGVIEHAAFATVKLGQVAQARGDREGALARYREGLAIFERLGMPRETAQVRQLIASLEGGGATAPNPIQAALAQARAAAERGEFEAAVAAQESAVTLMRQEGESREALVALSVLLFNLTGYYANVERHADAVRALEEVVALDERTGHPDLESDRQALEAARRAAAFSPEERARSKAEEAKAQELAGHLASLPPEERTKLESDNREFAELAALSTSYEQNEEWTLVIETYHKAIEILKQHADNTLITDFFRKLAFAQTKIGSWQDARESCQAAIEYDNRASNFLGLVTDYALLGDIFYRIGNYRDSILRYETARKLSERFGYKEHAADMLYRMGLVEIQVGEYQDGISALEQALTLFSQLRVPLKEKAVVETLQRTSERLFGQGLRTEAERLLKMVEAYSAR